MAELVRRGAVGDGDRSDGLLDVAACLRSRDMVAVHDRAGWSLVACGEPFLGQTSRGSYPRVMGQYCVRGLHVSDNGEAGDEPYLIWQNKSQTKIAYASTRRNRDQVGPVRRGTGSIPAAGLRVCQCGVRCGAAAADEVAGPAQDRAPLATDAGSDVAPGILPGFGSAAAPPA
jgi:hypothetical protein